MLVRVVFLILEFKEAFDHMLPTLVFKIKLFDDSKKLGAHDCSPCTGGWSLLWQRSWSPLEARGARTADRVRRSSGRPCWLWRGPPHQRRFGGSTGAHHRFLLGSRDVACSQIWRPFLGMSRLAYGPFRLTGFLQFGIAGAILGWGGYE